MSKDKTMTSRRRPTHPGAVLREDVLPAMGITVTEFAARLHVSRQTLHGVLAEHKPITAQLALRIGKLLGNGPTLWAGMQQAYDLWEAERAIADELRAIA